MPHSFKSFSKVLVHALFIEFIHHEDRNGQIWFSLSSLIALIVISAPVDFFDLVFHLASIEISHKN
jgi:hypothetical protein